MRHRTTTLPALTLLLASAAQGQTEDYRHSVFDNSLERDVYYYSFAQATAPSTLEGKNRRLPVDSVHFLSPPNALRSRAIVTRTRTHLFAGRSPMKWPSGSGAVKLPGKVAT